MSSWWLRPPSDDGEASDVKIDPPVDNETGENGPSEDANGEEPKRRRRRSRSRAMPSNQEETSTLEETGNGQEASEAKPPSKTSRKKVSEPRTRARNEAVQESNDGHEDSTDRLRWRESEETAPRFHQIYRESEVPVAAPAPMAMAAPERRLALFCDLENLALGVRDSKVKAFDINLVLERLLEKGRIIVKKAYCDWERYADYKRPFHEAAIEMIGIPHRRYSGKNSADIKMVVDAMDLSYSNEHLDTFVILSGDSDFSPLVSKLRENNKFVIGVGVKNSTSPLLIDNCDEFIYYEDVWRDAQNAPRVDGLDDQQPEVFSLLIDAIRSLLRENRDVLWGSMIKQTMQRKRPSFSESYYGYSSFSKVLEDAESKGLIRLGRDSRSGSYVVTGFAGQ